MQQFVAQHKKHLGKVVLQDRPAVIESFQHKDQLPFGSQAHDFFTSQLVQAARAYFLHSIIHDWSDEEVIEILENLKPAIKPGYSRVLLNEIVLSEDSPTIAVPSMDMMMLARLYVHEMAEADWKMILEEAGLRFLKIYSYPGVAESVIEAELEG